MNVSSKLKTQNSKLVGFTLIEVLVASTIFAFVSIVGIGIFVQTSRISMRVAADREVQQAARFAFEQMTRGFRIGSEISLIYSGIPPSCPADFIMPISPAINVRSVCSTRIRVNTGTSSNPQFESYGFLGSPACLARSPDENFLNPSCITPRSVNVNGTFSAYYDNPARLTQKPFVKVRATFEATTPQPGSTPKQFTFETAAVVRNSEKRYE